MTTIPICFCGLSASPAYSEEFGLLYECHYLHVNPWEKVPVTEIPSMISETVNVQGSEPQEAICGFHIHKAAWDVFLRNGPIHQELAICPFFNFSFSAQYGVRNYYSLSHPPPPNCFCGLPATMRREENVLIFICPNFYIDGARPKCTWESLANEVPFQRSNGCTHPLLGQGETRLLDPNRPIQNFNARRVSSNNGYNNHHQRYNNHNDGNHSGNHYSHSYSNNNGSNGSYHGNNSSERATTNQRARESNIPLNENNAYKATKEDLLKPDNDKDLNNNISCNNQEKDENQELEMVNNSNREQTRNKSVKNGIDSSPRSDCDYNGGIGPSRPSMESNLAMQVVQLKDEVNHLLGKVRHYRSEYRLEQKFRQSNQMKIIELQAQLADVMNKINELNVSKKENSMVCRICFDKDTTHAFLPCCHLASCGSCARIINKCPICRIPKKSVVRIYCS